ncbi:DUF58 domain-containing protein [Massilia arenosa]|uniref:DUF58 domain-containing protein n=1 Tax=Zemynaea arenosa TaxID=2561931 RepID=A0A4Y9SBL1_9BURK|nr:DUF58 domain-containing protein [Massilia arenosa]TFW17016.1 DUF58 domain-containing protein [Massilia arenosa]
MLRAVNESLRRRAGTWLFQLREAEPGEVTLNPRRVFIVPTKAGFGFCLLLLMLLIGSINYTLGLGFALTFTAGMCAVVDMVLTNRNLAWLQLAPGRVPAVFAGEEAGFEVLVRNPRKADRYAIWIDFLEAGDPRHVIDAPAEGSTSVVLALPTRERGWLPAPRVRLITRFPLGLFRAWSYWQPAARALVYPFPEPVAPPLPFVGTPTPEGYGSAGQDDFAGVRSYQPGDSMRHLAWRQIARHDPALGGALVTKSFEGGSADELVLDFGALPAQLDVEARLSRMARWVLDAEQRALPYAFKLGALEYPPSIGDAHRAACLRALALYGQPGEPIQANI